MWLVTVSMQLKPHLQEPDLKLDERERSDSECSSESPECSNTESPKQSSPGGRTEPVSSNFRFSDAPYGSPQWYNAVNYMNFTQLAAQMAQAQAAQTQVQQPVPPSVAMLNCKSHELGDFLVLFSLRQ